MGCAPSTVSSRLNALSRVGRWFQKTRHPKLSREVVRPSALTAYRKWLRSSPAKANGRGSLAPSTAASLQQTTRLYLQWASRHNCIGPDSESSPMGGKAAPESPVFSWM
jgi:hypothetical protein